MVSCKIFLILFAIFSLIQKNQISTTTKENFCLKWVNNSKNIWLVNILNSPILLLTTINGQIHAVEVDDLNGSLNLLWSFTTENLISSSIDKLEVILGEN